MNEKNSQEIRYRRLLFKLFDKGKSPTEILSRIARSRSWLFKWKQRFAEGGWHSLDSLSKAPHHCRQQYSLEVRRLVIRVRQRLAKSRVGLVSARAIQQELLRLRLLNVPPAQTTIKRWLRQAGLIGVVSESARLRLLSGFCAERGVRDFFLRLGGALSHGWRKSLRLSYH